MAGSLGSDLERSWVGLCAFWYIFCIMLLQDIAKHMDLRLKLGGIPRKVMPIAMKELPQLKQPLLSIQDWNYHETYWNTNKFWWQICWLIKWTRALVFSCCPVIFKWTSSHWLSFNKRCSFSFGFHDHVPCMLCYTVQYLSIYCIWCNIVLDMS